MRTVGSPKQAAELSEIVITMLPTGIHVQEVIQGKDGLIAGYRPGSLHLDTREFDDHSKLGLMIKDIGIAMKLAADQKLSLPIAELAQRLWKPAGEASEAGSSISEMVRWVEKITGTELIPS